EIIALAAIERVELAAARSGRPRLRPLATIHATIMLKSAAPSAGATDSFFSLVRDHTARRVCAQRAALRSDREWHERNFPLQDFAVRNRTGGQAIVAPRIAGGKTASLPIYRRIQREKRRPLESGRRNGVVPQR